MNTLIILGTLAYGVCVPGFAWLGRWMHVFYQPLDMPIDEERNLQFMLAGAAFGAIVATVVVGGISQHSNFAW